MPRQQSRRRYPSSSRQSFPLSSKTATLLLGCLSAISWGIVCGIILSAIGKLPALIVGIASGIQVLILLLVALFGAVGRTGQNFLKRVWESAHRLLAILLGILVASSVAVAIGLFGQSSANTLPTDVLRNAPPRSTRNAYSR